MDNQSTDEVEASDKNVASSRVKVKTLSSRWYEFVDGTTLHGIRHVFGEKKILARVFWLLFLLTSASWFFFNVYGNISKYRKFPMTTAVRTFSVTSATFPAVSVCPSNILQKRKIYTLDTDANFLEQGLNISACSVTAAVRNGRPCGHALLCCCVSMGPFDGSIFVPNCSVDYQIELSNAIQNREDSFNMEEFLRVYSRNVSEVLTPFSSYGPRFLGIAENDFIETITDFGKCFTFNSGKTGYPIRKIRTNGASLGLNLVLDLNVDNNIMAMWAGGVRVIIHNQGEYFDLWNGVLVSPGTMASIQINKRKVLNLPSPYETNCKSQDLLLYPTYTVYGCSYECYALAVQYFCGCRLPGFPANKSCRVCYSNDVHCMTNVSDGLETYSRHCYCSTSCEEIEYYTEQSVAKFPDHTTKTLLEQFGYDIDYARKNLVYLQIGYKSLSYDQYKQQPSYDLGTLLSQMGGNMGMFLGCSLLTLCEFVGFFVGCIF